MYQAPEQLVQFSKSSMETTLTLANITIQSTERLMGLQIKTARDALDHGMKSAQALADVRSMQDLVALQSSSAQPNLEKALAYSRSLYEVASDAQVRIGKLVETHMTALSGNLMVAMDKAVKTAPAGSESVFAAFKSAVSAANSAYDTMSRVTREAGNLAAVVPAAQAAKTSKKKAR